MAELNEQLEKSLLDEKKLYTDVVCFTQNPQKIFEREIQLCKLFQYHEGNSQLVMRHKVTNKGIYVWINFDSVSDWNVGRGRALLQHILRQFKSHLNGYEPLKVKGYQYNSFWEDKEKKWLSTIFL